MKINGYESQVCYYNRKFPALFTKAKNSEMYSSDGNKYIDFFAGAGALNYGHNNEYIKKAVCDYLNEDNIIQGFDLDTPAKASFIETFCNDILFPKGLNHKIQFCGPTGTNGVEAALKLAKKVTNRNTIFALSGGFHGMTFASLSVSGKRKQYRYSGDHSVLFFPPFIDTIEGYDAINHMEYSLKNGHSGVEIPAAIIIECVQAEGGVYPLPNEFLIRLRQLCDRYGIILIFDEIQVGCFRTGSFFSFENSGIIPDIVILSKSISGLGLPMSICLIKPQYDIWEPGEHNGTFRGNQLALVGAKAAIEYAKTIDIISLTNAHSHYVMDFLFNKIANIDKRINIRGRGMIWGVDFGCLGKKSFADHISYECFRNGLVIETCGEQNNVLKIMPPLTIDNDTLKRGLEIIYNTIRNSQ